MPGLGAALQVTPAQAGPAVGTETAPSTIVAPRTAATPAQPVFIATRDSQTPAPMSRHLRQSCQIPPVCARHPSILGSRGASTAEPLGRGLA